MLAILGLFGFAIATVMMTGDDPSEGDGQASDTLADGDEGIEILPVEEVIQLDDPNFVGGDTDESIVGTAGQDDVRGGDGDDWIDGGDGHDSVQGDRGDDTLLGGAGDDDLFGHVGDDTLFGGTGFDELNGGGGNDVLFGGEGNDSLLGSLGDDTLVGGDGMDVLFAGSGDDVLIGDDDTEADHLNGGAGDDILRGGRGDNLNGGDGADQFILQGDADAHVDDFNPAEDVIEVLYDPIGPPPTLALVTAGGVTTLTANDQIVARFDGAPEIDLNAVRLSPAT